MNEPEKIKVVFVVLHYMAQTDTEECISSITEKIDDQKYRIIIVDNDSPDDSGKKLKQKYEFNTQIIILKNYSNLGFANGNNVGFQYAKNIFNPDYIVLCNNDILLVQTDFLKKIEAEYRCSNFAVLGPMILTKDGRYTSSPSRVEELSKKEVKELLSDYIRCYYANKVRMLYPYYLIRKLFFKKKKPNQHSSLKKQYNVSIHGCFMVFSREYISKFDGLNSKTFMYGEEEILFKTILMHKLKSVYTPDIFIYHKEDASTNLLHVKKQKKSDFYYKNLINSTKVLLELYQ